MSDITGGCLCGNVRFTIRGEPLFQAVCHCTDCQRQTGTAFSVVAAFAPTVARDALRRCATPTAARKIRPQGSSSYVSSSVLCTGRLKLSSEIA